MLQSLCTTECEASLSELATAVDDACGDGQFNFNGQNMTFPQLIDFIQYKFGLICLADNTTGDFCSDVENTCVSFRESETVPYSFRVGW